MANVSVNIPPEMFKIMVFTGVGVAGYFLLKKGVNEIKSNNVNADLNDPGVNGQAARLALAYYQAIHENDFFGLTEDEAAILKAAKDGKAMGVPFNLVSKKYRNKYRKDLLKDIQDALSTSEFGQFQAIMGSGLGFLKKSRIIAVRPTKVYDKTFTKSKMIDRKGVMGGHHETVYIGAGQIPFYGFLNNNRLYYVAAQNVDLKSA